MLSKSRIKTSDNFLMDNKTSIRINFSSEQVAKKNAQKYSALLGQEITVVELRISDKRFFLLKAKNQIV